MMSLVFLLFLHVVGCSAPNSNSSIPCNGHGKCETKDNGQSCSCYYGFTGPYCEHSEYKQHSTSLDKSSHRLICDETCFFFFYEIYYVFLTLQISMIVYQIHAKITACAWMETENLHANVLQDGQVSVLNCCEYSLFGFCCFFNCCVC